MAFGDTGKTRIKDPFAPPADGVVSLGSEQDETGRFGSTTRRPSKEKPTQPPTYPMHTGESGRYMGNY